MAEQTDPTDFEIKAGVAENEQLDTGELIVGDYDVDNNLIGWHKEPQGV